MPTSASCPAASHSLGLGELIVAELDVGQFEGFCGCRCGAHRGVEVAGPAANAPLKIGMTNRGSTTLSTWVMPWVRQASVTASASEASSPMPVGGGRRSARPGPGCPQSP